MWSSRRRPGEDWSVVTEAVVWMVPLRKDGGEHKGVLTLEPPNLVFTARRDGERVEIALANVQKVRRVRGSPVLRVTLGDKMARSEVAFYFSQPPPLKPPPGTVGRGIPGPLGTVMGGRTSPDRTTKRVMRTNVGYLSRASQGVKDQIESWVAAIAAASGGSRG
jgi:hypothetical protein